MSHPRHRRPLLAQRAGRITLGSALLAGVLAAPAFSAAPAWQDDLLWKLRHTYADHDACLQALSEQHQQDQQAVATPTDQDQGKNHRRVFLVTDGPQRLSDDRAQYLRELWYEHTWIDLQREVEITSAHTDNRHLRCEGPLLREEIMAPGPPPSPGYRRLEPHELPTARSG